MKKCPFCSEEIQDEAIVCKHCKSKLNEPQGNDKHTFTETKDANKAVGGVAGFIGGLGCGIWLIVGGVLLSLTGIGAIIGIPLIFAGLFMPLYSTAIGASQIFGECPYCTNKIKATKTDKAITCTSCNKRVLIKDKKFFLVD